jgi:type I restriction enzyme R subunit
MDRLTEADTRAKLVDPALHSRGWTEDLIRREETAGAIEIGEGGPRRRARGRVDYVLRVKATQESQPVAVALIETKPEHLPANHGLEQAKLYSVCARLNVPFVYSCNGHLFVEFDRATGKTSHPAPLSEFPSPVALRRRYENAVGFSLESEVARPLLTRYKGGEATRRYYQDAAIRATLEKIARGKKRALLALATGSGKTFIAVNLLRRIADAGQLRRALFVCDRDELRSQALAALQNVFGSDAAPVSSGNPQKNARVLVATYQTLEIDRDDSDANFLLTHYPEDYFSHIVIDECHRSAWGKWSQVLTRNQKAIQVGLTATPRRLAEDAGDSPEAQADARITADNYRWFGEPVYEYDMAQGIEDGYLAACEIRKGLVNLDHTGITIEDVLRHSPRDATTGEPIGEEELRELYQKTDYEDRILLPDRVVAMCRDFFHHLLDTGGPEQKTIIFCVRDRHADDVAAEMNNLYADWCAEKGHQRAEPYAFKCTAKAGGGDYLPDLRGASRRYFVATTVELLTTGVDVPCVRNIVFFKYVRSPIAFYQMVGRGTRLYAPDGKLMFRVYDYTDATRLFGEGFISRFPKPRQKPGVLEPPAEPERAIIVEGFEVRITGAGRYIVTDVDGRATPVTVEEYKERLAERLVAEAPTLDDFRTLWVKPSERSDLLSLLPDGGRSAPLVRELEEMSEFDLYDVLAELGYGLSPKTRKERADAFSYKHAGWLSELPQEAAGVLRALAAQFARGGTEGLENAHVFQTPEVVRAGGLSALKALGKPFDLLLETKKRVFAA